MLLFIWEIWHNWSLSGSVSIHPMLLFILLNRSDVKGNLSVSIHPMLLFIKETNKNEVYGWLFQYIPCYSLSTVQWNMQLVLLRFNTSHVTLYLCRDSRWKCKNWVSIHPMLLFIYSHCSWHAHEHGVSIHPMLLFISGLECSSDRYYFVSIHPMLLFIWRDILRWLWTYGSFNTSHVTLYPEEELLRSRQVHVSIHPMLLFILSSLINSIQERRFNTSHVTLYQFPEHEEHPVQVFQYIPCYSLSSLDGGHYDIKT